jgi:hypothetical protein
MTEPNREPKSSRGEGWGLDGEAKRKGGLIEDNVSRDQ